MSAESVLGFIEGSAGNAFIGFISGFLMGLTGIGGGAVITPLLIWLGGTPAITAIGTSQVHAGIVKLFGAWQHQRQKTAWSSLVLFLALGSLPAAVIGVALLQVTERLAGRGADAIIEQVLGITLILVALVMLTPILAKWHDQRPQVEVLNRGRKALTITVGAIVGLLVGFTSIGAGSLLMPVLIFFYPTAMARLVGTDIQHGLILAGVAGFAHVVAGSVDWPLVATLLVGSIPGILLGSRLCARTPNALLRPVLALGLLLAGLRLT